MMENVLKHSELSQAMAGPPSRLTLLGLYADTCRQIIQDAIRRVPPPPSPLRLRSVYSRSWCRVWRDPKANLMNPW